MNKLITIKSHVLIALIAGYFTLVLNWPFFLRIYHYLFSLEQFDTSLALTLPVFLFSFLCILFSLFVIRGATKLLLAPLLIISAAVAYASIEYGVMFDYGMIENVIETNPAEASTYISLSSLTFVFFMGVVPAWALLFVNIEYSPFWRELLNRAGLVAVSLAVFAGITFGFYQSYASVGRNNQHVQNYIIPSGLIYSSANYINQNYFHKAPTYKILGEDARHTAEVNTKPTLMVMVVGETDRAANHQYNGYNRATDQFTHEVGMTSLGAVSSCGTATAVSVPCMFSFLTRGNYDKQQAYHQDNSLDVIQRAGVQVTWVDNDSGCKGVCDRVTHYKINPRQDSPLCDGETCFDEVMLKEMDQLIAANQGQNQLLVFHLIGSHGPTYYQRYPAEHRFFTPDCERSDIQNCSEEALKNTYDNSVRYTNFVVAQMVKRLQAVQDKFQTGLLYMSDHGESLGESGIFLHGLPYKLAPNEQKEVPALVWFSEDFTHNHSITSSCLQQSGSERMISQDYLSHSLLGFMDVSTHMYDPDLDIVAPCRNASAIAKEQSEAPLHHQG